jgi:hypothetical protein
MKDPTLTEMNVIVNRYWVIIPDPRAYGEDLTRKRLFKRGKAGGAAESAKQDAR